MHTVMRTGAAIVPTYIHGASKIWGRERKLPKLFGKTTVVFGSAILAESFAHLGKKEADFGKKGSASKSFYAIYALFKNQEYLKIIYVFLSEK